MSSLLQNNFTGVLPDEIAELPALVVLDIQHNQLEGQLDYKILTQANLSSVDASYNRFTGKKREGEREKRKREGGCVCVCVFGSDFWLCLTQAFATATDCLSYTHASHSKEAWRC